MIRGISTPALARELLRRYREAAPSVLVALADACAADAETASDDERGELLQTSVNLHRAAVIRAGRMAIKGAA